MRVRGVTGSRAEGETQRMPHKGVHFPLTTAQQRRLLFETWKATGSVAGACRTAHVGERTFYYWKARFRAGGYGALEHSRTWG